MTASSATFVFARHRELDTRAGAWLSPDPLGLAGGAHRQRYAEGDPIGFVDPLGLTAAPILHNFGHSPLQNPGVWEGPTTIDGPAGGGACTRAADACGGQQSGGGRRFILHGDDPPETDVDAGKSAWKERREARRAVPLLDRMAARNGPLGRFARMLGGDPAHWTMSTEPNELYVHRGMDVVVRPGFFERLGNRWEESGGIQGWWDRSFPDSNSGASAWSTWRAFQRGRDAAQINYAADALESAPTLLRFGGLRPLADPAEAALQRSGAVAWVRNYAAREHQRGLSLNPDAAELGADLGLLGAVVIDVAIPGPGGEARVAGEAIEQADAAAEVLARAGDEVMEEGLARLSRAGDDLGFGGAPTVTEQVIREAMQNAPLKSQQAGGVSLPRVQAYADRIAAGEVAPAIKVDGEMIVDGNYRYIAGKIMGQEPPIQPWAGGRPEAAVDWKTMPIDPEPW